MRTLLISAWGLWALLGSCSAPGSAAGNASSEPAAARVANPAVFEGALNSIGGASHTIAHSLDAGRPVVLVFWQSWCSSCVAEAPELSAAARLHPEFDFFGVVSGPEGRVDEFAVARIARELELPYPSLRDTGLELTEELGVTGTPTIIVVGPQRDVRYSGHAAPADWAALR